MYTEEFIRSCQSEKIGSRANAAFDRKISHHFRVSANTFEVSRPIGGFTAECGHVRTDECEKVARKNSTSERLISLASGHSSFYSAAKFPNGINSSVKNCRIKILSNLSPAKKRSI